MKLVKRPKEIEILEEGYIEDVEYCISYKWSGEEYTFLYINDFNYNNLKYNPIEDVLEDSNDLWGNELEGEIIAYIKWRMYREELMHNQAKALKAIRLKRHLKQIDMALDIGVDQTHISMVELEKRPLPKRWIKELQEVYNLSSQEVRNLEGKGD